ncbi:hypothetical protein HELRODRAFT_182380 [Helobdella robusta]|uniref:Calponin-homology (CH) domain-containing protein n=1 Tax=Helobdella robusta TaxID=6412 RepID=T1FI43_HELRO|nr:hypothetical protein HELRODRAFT_182380 [Helobdella robusta]ESN91032.1 hypothetical protein HELRODRAFT_182380 [Helobdella robusta]
MEGPRIAHQPMKQSRLLTPTSKSSALSPLQQHKQQHPQLNYDNQSLRHCPSRDVIQQNNNSGIPQSFSFVENNCSNSSNRINNASLLKAQYKQFNTSAATATTATTTTATTSTKPSTIACLSPNFSSHRNKSPTASTSTTTTTSSSPPAHQSAYLAGNYNGVASPPLPIEPYVTVEYHHQHRPQQQKILSNKNVLATAAEEATTTTTTTSTNANGGGGGCGGGSSQELDDDEKLKIYTNWANHYLERNNSPHVITNLQCDLNTGELLADLIEALLNIRECFHLLASRQVQLNAIEPEGKYLSGQLKEHPGALFQPLSPQAAAEASSCGFRFICYNCSFKLAAA